MNIPIVIVHRGDTFYLKLVLEQIRLFNPHNRICLISDASTNKYKFVEHYNMDDYSEGANAFKKAYIHMSSNPYEYELICFQRWFYIRDFVKKQNIEYFLCMDSDVLLYCSINEIMQEYISYDFTTCNKQGPGCALFNMSSISNFCQYIMSMYTEDVLLNKMKSMYQDFIDNKLLGGLCDMIAFVWFQDNTVCNTIDIAIPTKGACFDGCITWGIDFEMEDDKKKVYWINNLPYGKLKSDDSLIRFYCLHFQGRSKYSMYKYLLDENKIHHSGFWYELKWMFSKDILGARLKGIKKAINNPQMIVNFVRAKLK